MVLADFKNVSIVGHYVKDRTKDAQFIIIRFVWYFYNVITHIPVRKSLVISMILTMDVY